MGTPDWCPWRGAPAGRGLRAHYAHVARRTHAVARTHEATALCPHATQAGPEVWCTCPTTPPLTRSRRVLFRASTHRRVTEHALPPPCHPRRTRAAGRWGTRCAGVGAASARLLASPSCYSGTGPVRSGTIPLAGCEPATPWSSRSASARRDAAVGRTSGEAGEVLGEVLWRCRLTTVVWIDEQKIQDSPETPL